MAARKSKINTATLVRGRVYIYKNMEYLRGQETPVDEDTAKELEVLSEVTTDSDGEEFDKAYFDVEFDVDPKGLDDDDNEEDEGDKRRRRMKKSDVRPKRRPTRKRIPA